MLDLDIWCCQYFIKNENYLVFKTSIMEKNDIYDTAIVELINESHPSSVELFNESAYAMF